MSKWNCPTERDWRNRVEIESKRIALQITQGVLDGPDIADRIVALVVQASNRRPEKASAA